jgi:hypothetical protein
MVKKKSSLDVAIRATKALFGSLQIVLPVALVLGTIVSLLDIATMELLAPEALKGGASDQTTTIKLMFGWWGVMLLIEIFLGPIMAAMSIYAARVYSHGGKPSLLKAFNFALARYGKIFKWHAIAFLSIQVGMIAIVPGILFLLQYAFVDSILCLEDEKWPLGRSTHLTKKRRGRIFALMLPWLLFTQVLGFAELYAIGMGIQVLVGLMTVAYILNIWVVMVFYTFYEDRTRKVA